MIWDKIWGKSERTRAQAPKPSREKTDSLGMTTAARAVGLCFVTGLLAQGCAPIRVSTQGESAGVVLEPSASVALEADQEWAQVLNELFILQHPNALGHEHHGPSLVAGDWLAMQCALAGGYGELRNENDTPVFAGVPESWSRLE